MYDRPLYHRSPPSFLRGYSTRIMLGLLCSLMVVLLLLHLPVPNSTERVGWSTRPSERIPLSQMQREEETPEKKRSAKKPSEERNAPPPTRHVSPIADAASGPSTGNGERQKKTKKETSQPSHDQSQPVRSIAALSTEDNLPEIVGGQGSLYLQIKYPPAARKKGIEGRLLLHFTVGKNGNVRRIDVTESLHPLCDSAAVRALRSITFRPATRDGEPIPVRVSLPIRFQLQSTPKRALRTERSSASGG